EFALDAVDQSLDDVPASAEQPVLGVRERILDLAWDVFDGVDGALDAVTHCVFEVGEELGSPVLNVLDELDDLVLQLPDPLLDLITGLPDRGDPLPEGRDDLQDPADQASRDLDDPLDHV